MLFAVCDGTCWAVPSLGLQLPEPRGASRPPPNACCSPGVCRSCGTDAARTESAPSPRVSAAPRAPALPSVSVPFHNRAFRCEIPGGAVDMEMLRRARRLRRPSSDLRSKVKYLQMLPECGGELMAAAVVAALVSPVRKAFLCWREGFIRSFQTDESGCSCHVAVLLPSQVLRAFCLRWLTLKYLLVSPRELWNASARRGGRPKDTPAKENS